MDFRNVDFATVARGFGLEGYRIKAISELDACLNKSAKPDGPVIIDILLRSDAD